MYSYKLVSTDGAYQEVRSFASDSDAIEYVKGNFILFGSLRMTLNTADIYRSVEEGSDYYLAASVKMSTRELVQYYPIGYWTSDQDEQDEQQEAEQNENQTEDQTEDQSETEQNEDQTEDQSEAEQTEDQTEDHSKDHFLHVETVYQLARLDIAFNSGLCRMASVLVDDYAEHSMDHLAHAYGFAKGALLALCFHSVSGCTISFDDYETFSNQLLRLHELICERVDF